MAQVERFELLAVVEHVAHIQHLRGVEVLQSRYFLKFGHTREPPQGACRPCGSEGGVEDYLFNGATVFVPFRVILSVVDAKDSA